MEIIEKKCLFCENYAIVTVDNKPLCYDHYLKYKNNMLEPFPHFLAKQFNSLRCDFIDTENAIVVEVKKYLSAGAFGQIILYKMLAEEMFKKSFDAYLVVLDNYYNRRKLIFHKLAEKLKINILILHELKKELIENILSKKYNKEIKLVPEFVLYSL